MSAQLSLAAVPTMRRWAQVSPCGRFRYLLGREWESLGSRVLFVMLNPSTADADNDDPTITRCINFARSWGHGSLEVVNLYALRATDPGVLKKAIKRYEDVGDGRVNDSFIRGAALQARTIVLAWGAHVTGGDMLARARDVVRDLEHRSLMCLGRSEEGQPRHPLMLKAATALEPFLPGAPQ